jgi:hypothetical protein
MIGTIRIRRLVSQFDQALGWSCIFNRIIDPPATAKGFRPLPGVECCVLRFFLELLTRAAQKESQRLEQVVEKSILGKIGSIRLAENKKDGEVNSRYKGRFGCFSATYSKK